MITKEIDINGEEFRVTLTDQTIGQVNNLKTLNLGDNQISELPDNIGNFIHLEQLFIDNNNISSLPASICDIPSDCYVIATGNQLCEKYKWAKSCDINWDGITNNNKICTNTTI